MLIDDGHARNSAGFQGEAMTENRLFYYPYATMFDAQLPLL